MDNIDDNLEKVLGVLDNLNIDEANVKSTERARAPKTKCPRGRQSVSNIRSSEGRPQRVRSKSVGGQTKAKMPVQFELGRYFTRPSDKDKSKRLIGLGHGGRIRQAICNGDLAINDMGVVLDDW